VAIHITEAAAKKINEIIAAEKPDASGMRIAVQGGGCAGMSYHFDFAIVSDPKQDKVFEENGAKVVVDKKSYLFLNGTELSYSDGLNGGFKLKNPNVKASCGCGESFTV
jgi:iron-sulfur cluster assembly protein